MAPKWITLHHTNGRVMYLGRDLTPDPNNKQLPHGDGFLQIRLTSEGKLHVERMKGTPADRVYGVTLQREGRYQFGLNFGSRIKEPEDEKDPLKRVLLELNLPISKRVLRILDPDNTHHQQTKEELLREMSKPHYFGDPDFGVFEVGPHGFVIRIYLFGDADPEAFKDWLIKQLHGKYADQEFLDVLRVYDLDKATSWIASRFAISSSKKCCSALEWHEIDIGVDDHDRYAWMKFIHKSGTPVLVSDNAALNKLVEVYGFRVFHPWFESLQAQWVNALESETEALLFINGHYRVMAVEGLPSSLIPLRIARRGEYKRLTSPGRRAFFTTSSEDVVAQLFNTHRGLERACYETFPKQQLEELHQNLLLRQVVEGQRDYTVLYEAGGAITWNKKKTQRVSIVNQLVTDLYQPEPWEGHPEPSEMESLVESEFLIVGLSASYGKADICPEGDLLVRAKKDEPMSFVALIANGLGLKHRIVGFNVTNGIVSPFWPGHTYDFIHTSGELPSYYSIGLVRNP